MGPLGGFWIMWRPKNVLIEELESSRFLITCKVRILASNLSFLLINVYGPNTYIQKRQAWSELGNLGNNLSFYFFVLGGISMQFYKWQKSGEV